MSIITQTTQAAVLGATSNLIAQAIGAYQAHQPFALDQVALLKYTAFSILNTPPNVLWQEYLERSFPSSSKEPSQSKKSDEKKGKKQPTKPNNGMRNVLIKFALDQTFGAVLNTLLFLVAFNAMNGATIEQIKTAIKQDYWELYTSGLVLWPMVSLISFVAVPVERRILFGSIAGMAWGVYLSLFASR